VVSFNCHCDEKQLSLTTGTPFPSRRPLAQVCRACTPPSTTPDVALSPCCPPRHLTDSLSSPSPLQISDCPASPSIPSYWHNLQSNRCPRRNSARHPCPMSLRRTLYALRYWHPFSVRQPPRPSPDASHLSIPFPPLAAPSTLTLSFAFSNYWHLQKCRTPDAPTVQTNPAMTTAYALTPSQLQRLRFSTFC